MRRTVKYETPTPKPRFAAYYTVVTLARSSGAVSPSGAPHDAPSRIRTQTDRVDGMSICGIPFAHVKIQT